MMNIAPGRSGRMVDNLRGTLTFKSWKPTPLQKIRIEYTNSLVNLLAQTERKIGELNAVYNTLSDDDKHKLVTDSLHSEAVKSWELSAGKGISQFEFATLFPDLKMGDNSRDELDEEDIRNLEEAEHRAIGWLKDLPISGRLIQNVHHVMCQSERYEKKSPGWFRTSPTWLGLPDSDLNRAFLVFPTGDDLTEGISDLEKFINNDDDMPVLIKSALIHYQFEVLHPFIDGNGRIGRIINMLFMLEQNVLPAPILSLSKQLHRFSADYYHAIEAVELRGDYEKWIEYWLTITQSSAEETVKGLII